MPPQIKNDTMNWILKIGGFIMSIAIMVSSWFLNEAMGRINSIEKSVKDLEIMEATSSGSKFTTLDWVNAKNSIDSTQSSIDRRLIKLEENNITIKDSLAEIKQLLKEKKLNEP
jgi:hypothetical protein